MQTIAALQQAIQQDPNNPAHYYDLGGLQLANGDVDAAKASYKKALDLAPDHPQILLQLGNTFYAAGDYAGSVRYFEHCLKIEPQNGGVYYNIGNAQREMGALKQAVLSYQQAIRYAPQHAEAHNSLGNVYRELGQIDLAINAYEQALSHQPDLHHALAHLIHQKQHSCDWDGLDALIAQLKQVVQQYPTAQVSPFAFLSMPDTSMQAQLQCANQWAQQRFGHITSQQPALKRKETIHIAYLASDFRLHPLAYLITELLATHNREQFTVYAYSASQDASAENQAIRDAVDTFVDIEQMADRDVVAHMQAQGIDIVIDLTGYTKNSRTSIIAHKPAPISINWLGFPGSMGQLHAQSLFDYVLVDETIAPDETVFSEQCLHLPCYQPNNAQRPVGDAGSKAAHKLPEDAFVFCCFNQSFKITADMFDVWMQLLKRVENSVLWLLDCNTRATQKLRKQAEIAGIDGSRIIFAPRTSIADHLARHIHADLFLDTLPYNAHTTASDALYMGVPLITTLGSTFSGRVSASLLKQMSLDECITGSVSDYLDLASEIANSPEKHQALREKTKQNAKLLFNPTKFVTNVEAHYRSIYNALFSEE